MTPRNSPSQNGAFGSRGDIAASANPISTMSFSEWFLPQILEPRSEVFEVFDDDESGSISVEEFTAGIKSLELEITDEDVNTLIAAFDESGDGEIDNDELVRRLECLYPVDAPPSSPTGANALSTEKYPRSPSNRPPDQSPRAADAAVQQLPDVASPSPAAAEAANRAQFLTELRAAFSAYAIATIRTSRCIAAASVPDIRACCTSVVLISQQCPYSERECA